VVLDDAHAADDAALDALEYASLLGDGLSLWVLVAARPSFEQARPSWGARTERHWKATLGPLASDAAAELAARMLEPAEYPPAAVGQRLAAWSGGNPLCLSEIVLALKRAGVVRKRALAGTFYIATAELDQIPPSPAWQWLAARQLEGMSPELAAFARLCAALGDDLDRGAIEAVQDALDRAGLAGTPMDVSFGLASLAHHGLLLAGSRGRCSFQNALVHDAIRAMLEPAQRAAIHRAALEYYRARVDPAAPESELLSALAAHATACGALVEAADAHLRLGDRAQAEHKHVEADQRYTAALALTAEGDLLRRALALTGRGKSRCLLFRLDEAARDLAEARDLAAALQDRELSARVLLEEATALDWRWQLEASAQRVDDAAAILDAIDAPHLRGRLLVAQGRSSLRRMDELRQGSAEAIVALLERGIAASAALGDSEPRIIGLLLLPTALSLAGRHGDVEACFEDALALTAAAGDRHHLCVAYCNRSQFQRQPERAIDDLERAIVLAREIGNPWVELNVTYNVAERLHLGGRTDEALSLARRARLLEERFVEHPIPRCNLLLARILLLLGAHEEAGRHVAWVAARCPPPRGPHLRYGFYQIEQLILAELSPGTPPADETWDTAIELAERDTNLEVAERLEMLHWRARLALRGGRSAEAALCLTQARPLFSSSPFWRARIEALFALGAEARPQMSDG
jgi:tetratricopeptide (TPR) repeat protein